MKLNGAAHASSSLLVSFAFLCPTLLAAQTTNINGPLPDAPVAPLLTLAQNGAAARPEGMGPSPQASAQPSASDSRPPLSQIEAEAMALKNNPRVTVAHLLALAQHQVVRETRSAELPTATGSITAEEALEASRISAGSLTTSRLFTHAGAGGAFSQLITDFGRTINLVSSSKLQEKSQNANALATSEDIVLAADQAFFNALQAQALLKVADQNLETRNTTDTQVNQMTKNNLKSTLDLSFADVTVSQAKLLQLDARNNADSTMAALDDVLGLDKEINYELVADESPLKGPPTDPDQLVQLALQQRPDLQALNYDQQAAVKFSHAERDQKLPSITALGTAGSVPIRPATYYLNNWWGGVGVNMNIPIFNGFLFSAQAKEALIRAQADSEQSRDLRDRIVRDVRTAWLGVNTAYQRVAVTGELLKEANLALSLAQTRYKLGLSSIVELSQAQYQQTDAAIGNTNAQYQYRVALSTLNYQIGANP
jgi:outer membrane protein